MPRRTIGAATRVITFSVHFASPPHTLSVSGAVWKILQDSVLNFNSRYLVETKSLVRLAVERVMDKTCFNYWIAVTLHVVKV